MHILVAEDDAMNRDMIARRMRWEGFTITLAIDGLEALHLARAGMPDLILLDMGLPKQNGWDVARQLKSDEATRHIPIIALTAYALPEDRIRGLASGCDAYELKPIDFDRLMSRIRDLTAGSASLR
ncbi:response regulator [Roseiflexus sp.]|uniref:response regulator n=1 Tax=Roseiflexus sp. TaxID=2562120 RepID=UPI00398A713C